MNIGEDHNKDKSKLKS